MKTTRKRSLTTRIWDRLTRRNLFKGTGLAALGSLVGGCSATDNGPAGQARIPIPDYESLGVKPIINCYGTYTILSGSLMLPEVKMAMEKASLNYVQMDELMEAVGRRIGELTGAEWGIVTSGCTGALTAATAACIAGTDPEKMTVLPDVSNLKNEVIVPETHRHVYDRAIWMTGVKMIEVADRAEMERAVNDRTAMIDCVGFAFDRPGISLEDVVAVGKKYNIPTFVDAAAERPDVPNVYIEAGIDLVAYSGGKPLRGPQCTGLLIGRESLCRAAFLNISPHHGFGRPMKVGKEEILGCLTALDMWINGRDHDAEWNEWERRLNYIADNIADIPTVTTEIVPPTIRADRTPRLAVEWDTGTVKISLREVQKKLLDGNPRIAIPSRNEGLFITPWMMEDREEIVVAEKIHDVLAGAV